MCQNKEDKCPTCNGTGKITCPACHGESRSIDFGKSSTSCSKCKGSGEITCPRISEPGH